MPGLKSAAQIIRDANGIHHVRARNEEDLYFLQGWVHARDRLFQMDSNRRLASGTLAELVGRAALATDVELRTLGLRRAAELSLPALSPDARKALDAYARGVNAWASSKPLPPEYDALALTSIAPWTPVDSVVIGKLAAFGLAFELDIDRTVALQTYNAVGLDGPTLFAQDVFRSAPFDSASTVPAASRKSFVPSADTAGPHHASALRPEALDLARRYRERIREIPLFKGILDRNKRHGSNLWAVSGALTNSGYPLVANDPHLQLDAPSTFYPMGLEIPGVLEVFGSGFPGVIGIVQGYNRNIAWGSTNNLIDVTDTFEEQLVPDVTSPSGLSSLYKGVREPVIPLPEVFRMNMNGTVVPVPPGNGIPPFTLIVPRHGPIIDFNHDDGVALSVQYAGSYATREIDAFLDIDRASNLGEFAAALQFLDVGSQNFVYGDDKGNIAYFTAGEMPLREDLQAGAVVGLPPWFIRDGQGGNEWLRVKHPQPRQILPYEILPFSEMPKIVNPPAGWFVNSNNDPAGLTLDNNPLNQLRSGGGILYLAYSWDRGFRAGRITQRLREYLSRGDRKISFDETQAIQADVVLRDAEYFTPWIVQAFKRGKAKGADPVLAALATDPGLAEAVARLKTWDFSTPTGIEEGWDAGKPAGVWPTQVSVDASVAASIYNVWRSRFIDNTIDTALGPLPKPGDDDALAALKNLLDKFATRGGKGASGVDFFVVPGVGNAADRRDVLILRSVEEALALMAGPEFSAAFGNASTQDDYRWGKLHRIVFKHILGGPFAVPPAGGVFPPSLSGLHGISTDGGFQTVDAATHSLRIGAKPVDSFMFETGPVRRFVGETRLARPRAESIWPGGTSGVLGSPFYLEFLDKWLSNEAIPLHLGSREAAGSAVAIESFVPK